jgi:predicted acyl esterase
VRQTHGSEGEYVMTRPLKGPLNSTEVDHATDTYDAFWQNQAVDKLLAKEPLQVPMLIVSGLFDQEDTRTVDNVANRRLTLIRYLGNYGFFVCLPGCTSEEFSGFQPSC